LRLSKPAHFVSGEQQDAVEYLIHLLQQLHDEEVALRRPDCTNARNSEYMGTGINLTLNNTDQSPLGSSSYGTQIFMDSKVDALSSCNDTHSSDNQDNSSVLDTNLSIVNRLFGGTLVRHTSCTECFHTSSILDEPFSCLYVPVASNDEGAACTPNERSTSEPNHSNRICSTDVDLATLLRTHFSQIEQVSSVQACESCGKQTVLARRMCLKSLASHVLICLKVFTFCRESQTPSKIMKKIAIPERLSVTLSTQDAVSTPEVRSSKLFANEVLFPSTDSSDNLPDTKTEHPEYFTSSVSSSSASSPSDDSRSVTTRTFKLQGMILHHGLSLHCGHYTCVARVGMEWISFDDAFVHLTSLDQIYSKPLTTPYLLLYAQV
uniref:Ubiquitin carboxyl-terminal hydrolase 36 n=1 Tax=Echinostoma caproni TaxID=27848 RepID=A0A183B3V1_9TREM